MPAETVGVLVPADRIARVIGKEGRGLKQIRESTLAKCQVQQVADPNAGSRRVDLSGSAEQVASAFGLVLDKAFAGEQSCNPILLIPADKTGLVIGRGGENLKKVREECHVRIDVEREPVVDPTQTIQERVIKMQGEIPQMAYALRYLLGAGGGAFMAAAAMPRGAGAPHAAAMPMAMTMSHVRPVSADPDEMQLHMCVPDRLAGAILGKGGAQVKQTAYSAGCKVSMTTRDGSSDRRVVMIGTYQQCSTAQSLVYQQLAEAAQSQGTELNEATVMLMVRREAAGGVIGKQGACLKQIREQSNAKIQLSRDEVEGQRPCTITGDLRCVLEAERLIYELVRNVPIDASNGGHPGNLALANMYDGGVKRQDQTAFAPTAKRQRLEDTGDITKMLVPAQAAGALIGKQGSGLKQIRELHGVHVEMLPAAQAPQWPQDRVVILKGPVASRQSAVDQVLKVCFQRDGDTSCLKLLVPSVQAGSVIGKQGRTLAAIREQCGTSAQVEREEIMGERLVTATGLHSQVWAAASAILLVLENAAANTGLIPTKPEINQQALPPAFPQYHVAGAPSATSHGCAQEQIPMPEQLLPGHTSSTGLWGNNY